MIIGDYAIGARLNGDDPVVAADAAVERASRRVSFSLSLSNETTYRKSQKNPREQAALVPGNWYFIKTLKAGHKYARTARLLAR